MALPFLKLPALRVNQPLGIFYVISISAKDLLAVTFSEPLKYIDSSGNVQGSQRPKDIKRLKEIAQYIESVEMAFPNSIILAANYTQNGTISKDETERWRIQEEKDMLKLIIPKEIPLAAIIDGQHRLNAFEYVKNQDRFDDLQLLCSVYFDLPNSYQAFLFATINSNQKKVDRSLALEQFGYNVDDESEKAWTPEKFAVFLSRKLNVDRDISPFYGHIKVAPLNAEILFEDGEQDSWVVSTATIVDGICRLITSNPKRDRILMQQKHFLKGRSRDMISDIKDISPLRQLFINGQDQTIYDIIISYFNIVRNVLWKQADEKSYIIKTVGVQALFDHLRLILINEDTSTPQDINFRKYIESASGIDFSDKFFQASGIGRSRIKNILGILTGLINKEKIKKRDQPFYSRLLEGVNTEIEKDRWLWEDEAENAVLNTLEKAEWNYESKSVTLFSVDGYDFEKIVRINTYDKFLSKLVEIADTAFHTYLTTDPEIADEEREKFDAEELVQNCLIDYAEDLKKLGWT